MRLSVDDYNEESEYNDDIFNNEEMENPACDGVVGGEGMDGAEVNGAARFLMPAQNPTNRNDDEANQIQEEEMEGDDGDEDGAINEENDNDENMMRDVISVECQKLNGKQFIGTVNFSEAKIKIFQDGLGLDAGLLGTVKISFNKCPTITFKLKSKINVTQSIKNLVQATDTAVYFN